MKTIVLTISTLLISFSVFATISPIHGDSSICVSATGTLTDSTLGGTWSSSNTAIVTVTSTGEISGISAGTATITYTMAASYETITVIVHPLPAPITGYSGGDTVCSGAAFELFDTTVGGGTWTSSNLFVDVSTLGVTGDTAYVDFLSGGGFVSIHFTDIFGCSTYIYFLEFAAPYPVTGTTTVHVGTTTTLSGGWSPNAWVSANPSIAIVDSTTGVVTGISVGTVSIYSVNYCGEVGANITVLPPVGVPYLITDDTGRIHIYPNPVTSILTVASPRQMNQILITNLLGQIVYSNYFNEKDNKIDVSFLPTGIYLIKLNDNDVRKFVKK